jgi:predicted transcriptional regulator
MKTGKAMTIRLSLEQAEALETVADVDDQPVSAVIRAAIANHIEQRTKDGKFQAGLRKRIESVERLLERKSR